MPKANYNKNLKNDDISDELKEDTKISEIDVDALIKEAVAKALAEKEAEYESKLTETTKTIKTQYKYIPDELKVRLRSNVGGKFIFNDDKGKSGTHFEIGDFSKGVTVSYKELNLFINSMPTFIEKGTIAIIDVYTNEDIVIEDVIKDLRLEDLYLNEDRISPVNIEDLFNDKIISDKEFDKLLYNSLEMIGTVAEVAHILYKKGRFSNNTKMNTIRQISGNPNLFK